MNTVRILGAEQQAASSLALAYPERSFEFLTDAAVADGWDLPNVTLSFATPPDALERKDGVALCPRWLPAERRCKARLGASLGHLATAFAPWALPVFSRPGVEGTWRLKGDLFHRPDAPLIGTAAELDDVVDVHGCGLAYQREIAARGNFLVMGLRRGSGRVTLGVLELLAERFFRIDVIQAAEIVNRPDLVELSLAALDILDHAGYFSLAWLDTDDGLRLTSFRPVLRAGLLSLRAAGADLLAEPEGVCVARGGHRFVAYPHYSSYRGLGA